MKSILGAITSPQLLTKLQRTTNSVNPACGMFFLYIVETGSTLNSALSLSVKDVIDKVGEGIFTKETSERLLSFAEGRRPSEPFFSYENTPLTRSSIQNVWLRVSELAPPYLVSSLALRKTFYWNQYISSSKKYKIMRQLQLRSNEDVAKYFDVPIESLSPKKTGSSKTAVLLNTDQIDKIFEDTLAQIEDIKSKYKNTLLSDSYFNSLQKYIAALDSANTLFQKDISL